LVYKILIDDKVIKDLKKIPLKSQKKILETIKTKLVKNPFSGKKLLGDLSKYYKYRVGDYRIIYEILQQEITIVIIKIKHRKDVYK
jgi:mRNA interferase RelE/StbE